MPWIMWLATETMLWRFSWSRDGHLTIISFPILTIIFIIRIWQAL
jgi:hypothetical protein